MKKWRNKKQRPVKANVQCPNCGRDITDTDLFYGFCKCKYPITGETKALIQSQNKTKPEN